MRERVRGYSILGLFRLTAKTAVPQMSADRIGWDGTGWAYYSSDHYYARSPSLPVTSSTVSFPIALQQLTLTRL